MSGEPVTFTLPDAVVEIAQRAAEIVLAQLAEREQPVSPYLTVEEAAAYLRCSRQRVDDLLSQRRLTRVKEGARTLIRRNEIDDWLRGERRDRGRHT